MRSIFLLTALLSMALAPLSVKAAEVSGVREADSTAVRITVETRAIRVEGAQGQTLKVFSLSGRPVLSVKIGSPAQHVEMNLPKGCYIVKVGETTRKVVL